MRLTVRAYHPQWHEILRTMSETFFERFCGLTTLHILGLGFAWIDLSSLARIPTLKNLRMVCDCGYPPMLNDESLRQVRALGHLHTVDIQPHFSCPAIMERILALPHQLQWRGINCVRDADVAALLPSLPSLEQLDTFPQLCPPHILAAMPRLKILRWRRSAKLHSFTLSAALKACASLESLQIHVALLENNDAQELHSLHFVPQLRKLVLSGAVTLDWLPNIHNMRRSLEVLQIYGNQKDIQLDTLIPLKDMHALRVLTIDKEKFADAPPVASELHSLLPNIAIICVPSYAIICTSSYLPYEREPLY